MTIDQYAIIDGIDVVNVILLDDDNSYIPPEGHILIKAPEGVAIGWQFAGDNWIAPEPPEAIQDPIEDPEITQAKMEGLAELLDIGLSEATARRILGLPLSN